jgi:hypothetical protein
MLENWQQTVALLLSEVDIDVKVILAKNVTLTNDISKNRFAEQVWKQIILNTVNKVVNKNEINLIVLLIAKDGVYDIYRDTFFDTRFVDCYWEQIKNADGIRIRIVKFADKDEDEAFIIVKK